MSQTATPLETLIRLARDARDQAGQSLAGEQRNAHQAAAQLESLSGYRREYADRLGAAMREGIDPATLRNYQQFLASLDEAISRARQALDAQEARVKRTRQQWQQEQRRLAAYDTLAERRAAARQQAEQRREQHTSDDLVNSRQARRHAAPGTP